jgi:hypothetical protein
LHKHHSCLKKDRYIKSKEIMIMQHNVIKK